MKVSITVIACTMIFWAYSAVGQTANMFDAGLFNDSTYKYLVKAGFLPQDKTKPLTEEQTELMHQFFYYTVALDETKAINKLWQEYAKNVSTSRSYSSYEAKSTYYSNNHYLVSLSTDDRKGYDTVIGGERYILMIAWKSKGFGDYLGIDTPKTGLPYFTTYKDFFVYPFFVTKASELNSWIKRHKEEFACPYEKKSWFDRWLFKQANKKEDSIAAYKCKEKQRMRLMQLLGLTPASTNSLFVEMWVKEGDQFRPAIDSSINFEYMPLVLSNQYLDGLNNYSIGSFSESSMLSQYPFSGLGYTWDWNVANITHVGLSEFVLSNNRKVYIRNVLNTKEYIRKVSQ